MNLPQKEKEQLLLYVTGLLAERRLQRGLRLNYPEAIAYISLHVLEGACDGRTVAEVMNSGRTLLSVDQVMNGIETKVREVKVEATFREGTQLVTILQPIT